MKTSAAAVDRSPASIGAEAVREGVKDAFPIVLGYIPLGFAFGVLARAHGLSPLWATLMSVLIYSGSGQFIAVGLMGLGASPWTIVLTAVAVNIRYLLLSASLAARLTALPRRFLWLYAFQLTDETFAVASDRLRREQPQPHYLWGLNLAAHLSWIGGTLAGAAFGGALPATERWGIDFALPAMFISLVVGQCRRREDVLVALAAAGLTLLVSGLGGDGFSLPLAAAAAALLGVILSRE
ncbi:MAG: AzlC family ABC transporter permease [Bacillota bacterium]|nr:AzlC family ABC transporter permease [Bacillota bacterium]